MATPLPVNELERIAALESYDLAVSTSETVFDDLTNLAARVAGTNFAAVTLIDRERTWFKSSTVGALDSLPREDTFCNHTIKTPERPLIVDDLAADPRFGASDLVTSGKFGAYLGVPLVGADGYALGALCVIDERARPFDPVTVETMQTLARAVMTNFELRRALDRANGVARTDPLTGLLNRRAAVEAIDAMDRAGTPFTAVAIDLDYLKHTNDTEGHDTGDALLLAAAERLRLAVRHGDIVARLGGDEFAVMLVGLSDVAIAQTIAQRICTTLHDPVQFRGKHHRTGATLGVALYPTDAANASLALQLADEALVRTKRERRGSVGRAAAGES